MRNASFSRGFSRASGGFTLIEVLIALLILGVGLLAFALLQTMNVRFTKSAQQRTVASNLAYEIVDIMRTQRGMGSYFNKITYDSFAGADKECDIGVNAGPEENIAVWKCQVAKALPEGKAQVQLSPNGEVTVTMTWGDRTWESDVTKQVTAFSIKSRI